METDKSKRRGKSVTTSQQGEQGFTLLETSLALVMMMVVGLGAASLFFYAVGANTTARDRELSMAVAQQQMEQLRNTAFDDLDTAVAATGGDHRTATSAGRQYLVVTTIAETVEGDPTKKTLTVQVTPSGEDALDGLANIFGGVTLITERSTNGVGPNIGP